MQLIFSDLVVACNISHARSAGVEGRKTRVRIMFVFVKSDVSPSLCSSLLCSMAAAPPPGATTARGASTATTKPSMVTVVVCGPFSTGKTSLIKRFANRPFENNELSTTSMDHLTVDLPVQLRKAASETSAETVESQTVKVLIWDTIGQRKGDTHDSESLQMMKAAFRVADVVMLVDAVPEFTAPPATSSSRGHVEVVEEDDDGLACYRFKTIMVDRYIRLCMESVADQSCPPRFVYVANKIDMLPSFASREDPLGFTRSSTSPPISHVAFTSAKTEEGIKDVFWKAAELGFHRKREQEERRTRIKLSQPPELIRPPNEPPRKSRCFLFA